MKSKLPKVGISIFTEMSQLANQLGAINLSQGFPEFEMPQFLKDEVKNAIDANFNQYAPSAGLPLLLEQIASLIKQRYDFVAEPAKNITVTSGATEALFVAIQAIVNSGDEVIIFDPAYDSYEPAIELAGGLCRHIALEAPDYAIDWEKVRSIVNTNTKAIIINTPHNPTGMVMSNSDIANLKSIVLENDLLLISDEVYEFITFDGERHESVLRDKTLMERAFVISSFGKTFHCTGWKMGYCVGPEYLMDEFKKIHQYVTFSSFTPAQVGLTKMISEVPKHIDEISPFYQAKRDVLINALKDSRFKIINPKGTYFLLVDYSEISDKSDRDFATWLAHEAGVVGVPLSPFYEQKESGGYAGKIIRLCFAKNDATLIHAGNQLRAL